MNLIFFIIILLLILYVILYNTTNKNKEYFTGNSDLSKVLNDPNKTYVLWTGGYDSSFRVLQAVIDENKTVQPVYISDLIDNEPDKKTYRKNKENEYKAMETITNEIKNKFPNKANNILPLIDVKKIDIDDDIKYYMKKLKKDRSVRRSTCQYGAIAQLSKNINKNKHNPIYLEVGIVKEPHGINKHKNIGIYNTINNNVNINEKKLSNQLNNNAVNIFKYLKFPIIDLTKHDMLKIANKNGYSEILKHSWSCWYPNNGKP